MDRWQSRAGRMPLAWCAVLLMAMAAGPPGWAQTEPFAGDVNGDGRIDILDIQGTVNMALGVSGENAQGDVDLSSTVDVLDVQTITNSVLGVGGLVQRVHGSVILPDPQSGITVIVAVAVSDNGQVVQSAVDMVGGAFELLLPVRNAWSLAFFAGEPGNEATVGVMLFPLGQALSASLPLPNLSLGNSLDLGEIGLFAAGQADTDVRTLLSETTEPLGFEDFNGNGAPDLLEDWLLPLPVPELAVTLGLDIDDEDAIEIVAALANCAEERGLVDYSPDLSSFVNGLPRQIEPLLLCVPFEVEDWIRDNLNIQPWMEPLLDQLVASLTNEITKELEDWFADPGIPEIQDDNRNTVPDYIEEDLCVAGAQLPGLDGNCVLDSNEDGIPDFTESVDGTNVPRLFSDTPPEGDMDGDGVPDSIDVDADNSGIPDYAE